MIRPDCLSPRWLGVLAAATIVLAGCREDPVRVYDVPRDKVAAAAGPKAGMSTGAPAATPVRTAAGNRLEWAKPAAWTEKPASEMRLASYDFATADGAKVDVSVFSFPDAAGGLLANINRWRGQVGLEPVDAPEASATRATIAGREGWLVDLAGTPPATAPAMGAAPAHRGPTRILGAIVSLDGQAWFFKAMGPDAAVDSQRDAFRDLVASIRAVTASTAPAAAASADPHAGLGLPATDPHAGLDMAAATPGSDPHAGLDMGQLGAAAGMAPTPPVPAGFAFEVPAGWQQQAGSAMRVASFLVPAQGVRSADVSVFALGGPAGGEAGNVNRWRGQLGLPPADPAAIAASAVTVAGQGVTFRVFDLESTAPSPEDNRPTRIIAAILPRGDRTWFVKMTGETAHVASQREAFVQFIQSFRFDEAR